MPTSILMEEFSSGYVLSVCTTMSISLTTSLRRRLIVARRKYLWEAGEQRRDLGLLTHRRPQEPLAESTSAALILLSSRLWAPPPGRDETHSCHYSCRELKGPSPAAPKARPGDQGGCTPTAASRPPARHCVPLLFLQLLLALQTQGPCTLRSACYLTVLHE